MNVVSIDGKHKDERKEQLLEVLDEIKKQIEEGKIREFVACSIDEENICQIHVSCLDLIGGVGLFEVGKHLLIQNDQM
jgi:hypothetical protein